jgi:hypothetical protein
LHPFKFDKFGTTKDIDIRILKLNALWCVLTSSKLSEVRVTRSLVLCVCYVDRCLFFCHFSFGHCVVCPSIYLLWLPLWYLQTLLSIFYEMVWHRKNQNWVYFNLKWLCQARIVSSNVYGSWDCRLSGNVHGSWDCRLSGNVYGSWDCLFYLYF